MAKPAHSAQTKPDPTPTPSKEIPMTAPATDTAIPAAATKPAKPAKEKTSDREYLNDAGEECDISVATISRYTLDWRGHKGIFDLRMDPAANFETRCIAAFGWPTKVGNVVNTWKTTEPHLRAATPVDAVNDWMAGMRDPTNPTWSVKRATGPRFNMLKLAEAFIAAAKEDNEKFPSAEWTDAAWVTTQLELPGSPVLDAIRTNPKVMAKYDALIGKTVTGFAAAFAAATTAKA